MGKFDFLENYIINEEDAGVEFGKHGFYKLINQDISDAEKVFGRELPGELREFYTKIGYGFLCKDNSDMINRLMDPLNAVECTIAKFGKNNKDMLVFFEVSEESYLLMNLRDENSYGECPIYYYESMVASSLLEFVERMNVNPDYYL